MAGRETRAVETSGLAQISPRDQRGNSEIWAIEITCSRIGDAPRLPDLLDQIADGQRVGMVTADIAIECKVCGHAGLVPVAPVLPKGDRTVDVLVAAARCSRCRAKIVGTYRIAYGGRSDIAMALTGQMPQDT